MRRALLRLASIAIAAPLACLTCVAGCSSAGGSPSGGADLFDAGPAPIPDAGPVAIADAGAGITWTDLYRDFFGNLPNPPGPGCAGTGVCHGAADQGGGSVWVCGTTKDSCWKGLTTASTPLVDPKDPDNSILLSIALRQKSGGNMPQSPASYVFSDASIKRIRDWMAAGAQNN